MCDLPLFNILYAILCLNISDVAVITAKNVDYRCVIYNISKSEAINLLEKIFSLFKTFFLWFFCLVYTKWLILWTSISL